MDFQIVGEAHLNESRALAQLARQINVMSREYREIAKFYAESEGLELSRNQHKVLSFLYSVYYLDNQSESPRTWSTTREISEAISVSDRGDWARRNCRKLLNMNLISQNEEGKWYIAKYGIFYMHCETSDQNWSKNLIFNASIGALEVDLKRMIRKFIKGKIKENNEKFEEKRK